MTKEQTMNISFLSQRITDDLIHKKLIRNHKANFYENKYEAQDIIKERLTEFINLDLLNQGCVDLLNQ